MREMLSINLFLAILFLMNTVYAGAADDYLKSREKVNVGVVVIGSSDFRTPDYFKYIAEEVVAKSPKRFKFFVGSDVQSKYQEYWIEKGFLEEQTAKKQDLLDFVKFSQYGQVLYLIVRDPVTEKHSRSANIGYGYFSITQARTSVQINAFLCDEKGIVKNFTVIKEDDSDTSELRAKRGAFRKSIKEISAEILSSLG